MRTTNTMITRSLAALASSLCLTLAPGLAHAHFIVLQGGEAVRTPNTALELTILFSHPFTAGPDMQLDRPLAFELVHQRGDNDPTTTDLLNTLAPIEWQGKDGMVSAFRAALPASRLRSAGDYTFVVTPSPYFEATEDIYLQQIAKLVVNVEGVPGNWDQPLGLPAEIVPLDKPYANWVGGVFRGTVLSNGEPVPHAELEVEYLNHALDSQTNAWLPEPFVTTDNPNLEVMSIRTDAQGNFAIGLPREGWWGIGALGVGPQTIHEGKPLSQDAILWIYATAMK